MKAVVLKVLKSSVAFSTMCSSVMACGLGGYGGYGGGYYGGGYSSGYSDGYSNSYPVYSSSSYSSSSSKSKAQPPAVARKKPAQQPARQAVQSQTQPPAVASVPEPTAPAGQISVVPTVDVPVGNIQVASELPEDTTSDEEEVEQVAEAPAPKVVKPVPGKTDAETLKAQTEINKKFDALKGDSIADLEKTEEPKDESPIADALKGLVGTWMAVSKQGEGELSTVELQMDDNGTAKLTIPGSDGKTQSTTRKVKFDDEKELKLIGSGKDITLGKLVDFDARQMVLDRDGRQVTFVRPN